MLAGLCILMMFSVYDRYTIERDMLARRTAVESELEALKDRKMSLEEKVTYLRDERGVEAEIRKHFDVAKDGEQVIVLVEDKHKADTATPTVTISDKESFWSRIWPW